MPIHLSIMDHEVFGPLIRQGLEQGLEQGRVEGQLEILLTQIEKRFGAVSPRIRKRLASLDHKQLKSRKPANSRRAEAGRSVLEITGTVRGFRPIYT